ncbi:MAG: nucleotidyltransferase family protein [Sphingomonadales bacterium]|nr:nucleotidyltransferase family protein [Sphingomonadales bacterium]MBD3772265.1 nucleotidyltransferase family protein [Paracoccaceae bacterium]
MTFNALVLAGSRPGGDPLAGHEGVPHKALIALEGEPLLARVVGALRVAGAARIAVSANEPAVIELARTLGVEVLEAARGPAGSVMRGFDVLGAPLLVTTADHALLQGDWVRQIVDQAPMDCDVAVMLARREKIEQAMPGSKRTYWRFADGQWSGCNLFYLRTDKARAAIDTWQGIEADRKRPWKIAAKLGLGTLAAYALGRLSLAEGLARLGRRIGIGAALVPAENGLAAVDVDKQADLADIRALLASREA